jgi:hypothetical protein
MEFEKRLRQKEEKDDLILTRSYADDVIEITKKQSEESKEETDGLEKAIQALKELTLQEGDPRSAGQDLPRNKNEKEHDEKEEMKVREVYPEAELTEQNKIFMNEDITKSEDLRISVERCTLKNEYLEVGTTAPNQEDDI